MSTSFVSQAAMRQLPGAPTEVACGTSSAAVDLSGNEGAIVKMWATGGAVFVRFDDSAPTATTDDFPIAEGRVEEFLITSPRAVGACIGDAATSALQYEIEP